MFPIESFINQPAAPLGACVDFNLPSSLARFNRSALLYARVRSNEPRSQREHVPRRAWRRPRAGPNSLPRSPVAPQRIVRRLIRQ